MEPRPTLTLDEIDLSDPLFWSCPRDEREGAFLTLREQDPLRFFKEPIMSENFLPDRRPRPDAAMRTSRRRRGSPPSCSGSGTNIGDMPTEFPEFLGSMINMDDPYHARMRGIVSRGFTPRLLDQIKGDVEAIAAEIVDGIIERGRATSSPTWRRRCRCGSSST